MSFSVYILWSRSLGKYYIDHTPDLVEQLLQHNGGQTQETRPGIPWKLMYHEEFADISDAVTRAEEIRTRKNKSYIEQLIDR
jgi:putative endonuclease